MKIRTDFVTNSSSSSFILARKGTMNTKQKEAILNFIENYFFGEKIISHNDSPETIHNALDENYIYECADQDYDVAADKYVPYYDERSCEEIKEISEAIKNGNDIYYGSVSFECDNSIAYVYEKIWKIMEKYSDDNFEGIDADLSY